MEISYACKRNGRSCQPEQNNTAAEYYRYTWNVVIYMNIRKNINSKMRKTDEYKI